MDDSPDGSDAENSVPTAHSVSEVLKASQLKEVVQQYAEALRARRKGIDDLNVYPVPDGDTGTNMSLTVQSVVNELKSAAADDMHSISGAISKGAIMGARGNSGAILAQALRGIAESVKEKASIGPEDVAQALERARKGAYESVLKPVEGTILTVITAASEAARKSADQGHKLAEQLEHIRIASADALARTPELLPVLKQAGVVDAGGSGFLLFVDALRYVATGEPIPSAADEISDHEEIDLSHAHSELSDLRYEVMFLMNADDKVIPAFREKWNDVGDSIVVVGGDGLWNCHIHSDDQGAAIETALAFGKPFQIRVTDLQEQASSAHGESWQQSDDPVETAVVVVAEGAGITAIYRSMGAQGVVGGGQSMNPSVAELLAVVEAVPSEKVIILPNNKNIVAAANSVNALSNKSVAVVETKSMIAGMSALFSYDANQSLADNLNAMTESASSVTCGEVTQAVRATKVDAGSIKKGDWLGLESGSITVIAKTLDDALLKLVESMCSPSAELVTVVEGVDATEAATAALQDWLATNRPNVEVEIHNGDQALYPYLLGVE